MRCQGSQVSLRVARGSASWLSSHGRGLGSFFSSLSPVALGHWSVCRLRISLSTLLLGLRFGKFLKCPWVLRRQAWIPGSLLPRACQVEVEAEGRSELWWPVLSWGQWTPLASRVVHGVTGHLSICMWNLWAFPTSISGRSISQEPGQTAP